MTTNHETTRGEIEGLLPWYATGALDPREARRVEAALENDPDLARAYALVREELAETIGLNESLGAPSARAMSRLFERIEAEAPRPAQARSWTARLQDWMSERLVGLAPRTLAWTAVAAAAVIAVQAGFLAHVAVTERGAFETASGPPARAGGGSFLLIGFADQAAAADIASFLQSQRATIVDGPRAGGLYRIRLETAVSPEELQRIASAMRQQSSVVRFVAPAS
jgi:hypothetical protein